MFLHIFACMWFIGEAVVFIIQLHSLVTFDKKLFSQEYLDGSVAGGGSVDGGRSGEKNKFHGSFLLYYIVIHYFLAITDAKVDF